MVRFLHRKTETGMAVIDMIRELERLLTSRVDAVYCVGRNIVKWIRSDGGGGYIGAEF